MTIDDPYALVGYKRLVFDGYAWEQAGHDVGDNSCFWKPAKIVRVYERDGEYMADVIFDGDDGESRGHFIDRFREIETRGND